MGVVLQGVYLLTSIGLNITKRTEFYPMATGLAAATSIGANLALVPGYGAQAPRSPMRSPTRCWRRVSAVFAHRVYPVDYEWGRMARLASADLSATLPRSCGARQRGPPCRRCWRVSAWPAGLHRCARRDGLLTAVRAPAPRGVWARARKRRTGRARPAEVEAEVSETTELAGNVVSATAGEIIEAPDEAARARRRR